MSNKARREDTLIRTLGITGLTILILAGVAGASPFAYVSNYDSNNISVIDTSINKVTATVDVGDHPAGVAVSPDGKKAYVVNAGSNTVSVIDTAKNKVIDTVKVGTYPQEIAVSPDGTKAYVTSFSNNTVSVIDT
ncbi:MAG: cytochrome D1 domain-containing protein, partial [Methanosarcina sp.]